MKLSIFLSKKLGRKLGNAKLPTGLKRRKVTERELEQLKEHWLVEEMRDEAYWKQFTKDFDTNYCYTISSKKKPVVIPCLRSKKDKEEILFVLTAGKLKKSQFSEASKFTWQLVDKTSRIVGGYTFGLKYS